MLRSPPFQNRTEAGLLLAGLLRSLPLVRPIVLAIPRGGVEVAAPIAHKLNAELDVILSRKLRTPSQPELAFGAVSESGEVVLAPHSEGRFPIARAEFERERDFQLAEIERRAGMFRAVRPRAPLAARSVILTDDGIATGSTLIAAVHTVRAARPRELIVALPVLPAEREDEITAVCRGHDTVRAGADDLTPGRLVCLLAAKDFWSVGQFYQDFAEVSDQRVIDLLREFAPGDAAS